MFQKNARSLLKHIARNPLESKEGPRFVELINEFII